MTEINLTAEERRSLTMWLRQAIVQLEREEVLAQLQSYDEKPKGHRPVISRRKAHRSKLSNRLREIAY